MAEADPAVLLQWCQQCQGIMEFLHTGQEETGILLIPCQELRESRVVSSDLCTKHPLRDPSKIPYSVGQDFSLIVASPHAHYHPAPTLR